MFKKRVWLLGICILYILGIFGLIGYLIITPTKATTTIVKTSVITSTPTTTPTTNSSPNTSVIPSTTSPSTLTTATTLSTTTQSASSSPAIESTIDSVVQVWIIDPSAGTKNFEALGVPVGDGTAILTIIDYEDYAPANGDIEVTTQNNETFLASIQAIDARTGATLLKLDSGSLPPVAIRDPATLKANEPLIVWAQINSNPVPEATNVIEGPDTSNSVPLYFGVYLPDGVYNGV